PRPASLSENAVMPDDPVPDAIPVPGRPDTPPTSPPDFPEIPKPERPVTPYPVHPEPAPTPEQPAKTGTEPPKPKPSIRRLHAPTRAGLAGSSMGTQPRPTPSAEAVFYLWPASAPSPGGGGMLRVSHRGEGIDDADTIGAPGGSSGVSRRAVREGQGAY